MLPRHAAALSVALGLASSATPSLADRPTEKPSKVAPQSALREATDRDALKQRAPINFDVELTEGPPSGRPDDLDTARSFAGKVFALDESYRQTPLSAAPIAGLRAKELRGCRGECSAAPHGLEVDLLLVVTQRGCALSGVLIDLQSGLLTGKVSWPVIGGVNPPAGAIASLNASGPVIGGTNPPPRAIASLNASGPVIRGANPPAGATASLNASPPPPSSCDDAVWFEGLGELVSRARELDRQRRQLPSKPICRTFSDLPRGRVVLESKPWATVVDEGLLIGSTPLERSLSAGCHRVTLIAGEGPLPRRSKTLPLLVSPGQPRSFRASLE